MCSGRMNMQESNRRSYKIDFMPIRAMTWRYERSARKMILNINRKYFGALLLICFFTTLTHCVLLLDDDDDDDMAHKGFGL